MLAPLQKISSQLPLFHIIESDDQTLANTPEAEWFQIVSKFFYEGNWVDYTKFAAEYYNALYEFNCRAAADRKLRAESESSSNAETKQEACQRLLFDRATMQEIEEMSALLFKPEKPLAPSMVVVDELAPGIVPIRFFGKKPKCFFSLFAAFLGTTLMGYPCEPEHVFKQLKNNPSFARACCFAPKGEQDEYCQKHIPSLRKIEQFDQIMTSYGIWNGIKLDEVRANLASGLIQKEAELVGDTTHYYSYSTFETVEYTDEKGKIRKKSQSKITKNCRCKDRKICEHPWELADPGSGTVVKSKSKMYWAHKASIIGYPVQGIPLDAVAISDGSTFDGKTLYPHVEKVFKEHPEIQSPIQHILYDSACDDQGLKEKFNAELGITLKASLNPRKKKDVTEGLPRGIIKITPYGVPICKNGYELDYQGIRFKNEKFIFKAPTTSDSAPVCNSCPFKLECCPNSLTEGRTISVRFDSLPHIDPADPPMAKRFKAIMRRRPSVERMIKKLKCDLGDDRLSKRGNAAFQAYLDKSMIAFHLLLRQT